MPEPVPPPAPHAKRIARIDRDLYALRMQVASLHRSVAFLQNIGLILGFTFIALMAVGAIIILMSRDI